MAPSAADAAEVGETFRVVLFLMGNSVARSAVRGDGGPEHPDSGLEVTSSATQRCMELIE
jgi:hypothetical protein